MQKTRTRNKPGITTLCGELNNLAVQSESVLAEDRGLVETASMDDCQRPNEEREVDAFYDSLFEKWDDRETLPEDFFIDVPIDSLESSVGYSSLFRQMHKAFVRQVAFYKSPAGGSLSVEDARKRAFHACTNKEEAKQIFAELMNLPLDLLNFVDLMQLQSLAPRVAEGFWENAKREGRKEFESGHAAANITFPAGYMKQLWTIARFIGVRESFMDEWNPKGGIEVALIDMMAQSYSNGSSGLK